MLSSLFRDVKPGKTSRGKQGIAHREEVLMTMEVRRAMMAETERMMGMKQVCPTTAIERSEDERRLGFNVAANILQVPQ
jgi:hypothetical protein